MPFGGPPPIVVEAGPPIKISVMNAAAALTGAELVPLVQGGLNVRSTATAIAGLAAAVPSAPVNSLQFNNAGAFGGSANATFVSPLTTLHTLTVSTGLLTVTPGTITTGTTVDMSLATGGGTQLVVDHIASATSYVRIGGSAGGAPFITSDGSVTNIGLEFYTKGTGEHLFTTSFSGLQQFKVGASAAQASAADLLTAAGGNGNAFLTATGGTANINVNIASKGTGVFNLWKTTQISGQPYLKVIPPTTPANYISIAGTNTAGSPSLTATGSDASVNMDLIVTGGATSEGSTVSIRETGSSVPGARFYTRSGGVAPHNYLEFVPSLNTGTLIIRMAGSGGNVPITITPGGTAGVIMNPGSGTTFGLDSGTGTTANLMATPTTLNVGANATTVQLGKNAAGTVTIGPATIVGSQTTQNLWNTVATTINFGGAATTVNIGALAGAQINMSNGISANIAGDFTVGVGDLTVTVGNINAPSADISAARLLVANAAALVISTVALTDGAGAAAGTLLTSPLAGNPTKWIPIDDNGTTRHIPAW